MIKTDFTPKKEVVIIDAHWIERDETPMSVFNPLTTDFVCEVREDSNQNKQYIIRSMEIETFPTYLAKKIVRRLITAVQNKRGINPITDIDSTERIRKEVEIDKL